MKQNWKKIKEIVELDKKDEEIGLSGDMRLRRMELIS